MGQRAGKDNEKARVELNQGLQERKVAEEGKYLFPDSYDMLV